MAHLLTPDPPAIILRHDNQSRARPTAVWTVRPGAELLRIKRVPRLIIGSLTRMLYPDEHRSTIRCHEDPRDFALIRADEKAPRLPGFRMCDQHLIVAESCIGTGVNRRGRDIGLNPDQTASIHVNAVRRAVLVAEDR